jgi:hypothetical protein
MPPEGIIAYSSGGSAEETVKYLQGINKNNIEEHEEMVTLTGVILTEETFEPVFSPPF